MSTAGAGPGAEVGVRLRPWRDATDFAAMSAIANRAAQFDGLDTTWDVGFFDRYFAADGSGRSDASVISIVDAGGEPVAFAYGHWEQDRPDRRVLWTRCRVDPEWRRQGLGRRLLAAAQAAARRHVATLDPTELPLVLRTVVGEREAGALALLRSDGYAATNWITHLIRPALDDPPDDTLPAGIDARPATRETAIPILEAMCEAFRAEWWFPGMTDDQIAATLEDPIDGQLDVWQVAWDGDVVVGGVLGFIEPDENEMYGRKRGYTERIFTRREYRGRRIASALIGRSLRALAARGMTEAALSTDSDSPNGALGLYERHGFVPDRVEIGWERSA
jgi:GNAT superfamily N-acetyltransferase